MKRNTRRGLILSLLTGLFILAMGACDGCGCNSCGGSDCGGIRIDSSFDGESSGGFDDDSQSGENSVDDGDSSEDEADSSQDETSSEGGSSSDSSDSVDDEEHNFVLLKFDETGHWYECACGKKADKDEHHYQYGKEIASCGDSKTYAIKYCDVCGYLAHDSEVVLHPHDYVYIEPILATCTEGGVSVWYQCATCGLDVIKIETEPLGHLPSNEKTQSQDKEVCCYYSVCLREGCGQNVGYSHEYAWELLGVPVCGESVQAKGVCNLCQYETVQEFLVEHTFSSWEVLKDATCKEDGEEWRYCLICGEAEERNIIKAEHSWGAWLVTKVPNCKEEGEKARKCFVCGEIETESMGKSHTWGKWTVIKEETCTEDGERQRTCTRCGKVNDGTITARHLFDDGVVEKEPTCTEKGETVKTCTRCGETESEEIDALGHDWEITEKPPTEEEAGYVMRVCRRCGLQYITYYPDGSGGLHSFLYEYDEGEHWLKCTKCSYTKEKEQHAFTIVYEEKDVLDEEQNVYEFTVYRCCFICGYRKLMGNSTVHEHIWAERIPPTATCESGGLSEGLKCSVPGCDEVYVQPEEVGPLGHVLTKIAERKPTCMERGWYAYEYCQRYDCDYTTCQRRAPLGHDYVDCICTRCGDINLEPSKNLGYALSEDGTYYTVTGIGTYAENRLVIPSTYNNLPVKAVKSYAFSGASFTSVIICEGLTTIESGAFGYLPNLTQVILPDSLTEVGESAFVDCGNLQYNVDSELYYLGSRTNPYMCLLRVNNFETTTVTIHEDCKIIGGGACSGLSKLSKIVIPEGIISIGAAAFYWCSSLTEAVIPDSVKTIGNSAFAECRQLTNVRIGKGVTYIGWNVFGTCFNLQYTVEGGVNYLGNEENPYLFTESVVSTDITSAKIREGCKLVDHYLFAECKNLLDVTIPNSVTFIGDNAFYNCHSLKGICIPESVTFIGQRVFSNCNSLTDITVEENNAIYQSINGNLYSKDGKRLICYANGKMENTFTIPEGVTHIEAYAFEDDVNLTEVILPSSITYIGYEAFSWCDSLVKIVIPDSVTYIGEDTFYDCESLTIYCEVESKPSDWDENWNYENRPVVWNCKYNNVADDGCVYEVIGGVRYALKDGYATVVKQPKNIQTAVIPDIVTYNGDEYPITSIARRAFLDCNFVTSVTIGNNVTAIEEYAFMDCSSLSDVVIGNNVITIGDSAFSECDSLTEIFLPASVRSIDSDALLCHNLEKITVDKNNAFYQSIDGNLYNKNGEKLIRYAIGKKDTVYVIPEGVTEIGGYAFYNCVALTEIIIPDSVTSIGHFAFAFCENLKKIVIPNSVTSIGHVAFAYCENLTEVVLSNEIKSISDRTFISCSSLTSIKMPDGVTSIGEEAFSDCVNLTGISIPESVTSIGDYAFYNCNSLTSVEIPDDVTSIGYCAFSDCDSLTSVVIPNSVTTMGGWVFVGSAATVYCEAASKPSDWSIDWNVGQFPIVWDCNNNDVAEDGYIYMMVEGVRYAIKDGVATVALQPGSVTTMNIPSSITYKGISYDVTSIRWLGGNNKLISIVIGNKVTNISTNAFSNCKNLTSITFNGTVEEWNAIEKGENWNKEVPATEVVCSNGKAKL